MNASFPNPVVKNLSITALFPYNIETPNPCLGRENRLDEFRKRLQNKNLRLPDGWHDRGPDDFRKHRLDRWFYREIRCLLIGNDDNDGIRNPAASGKDFFSSARFRWLTHPQYHVKLSGSRLYVALIKGLSPNKTPETMNVDILGKVSDMELIGLFSDIGTAILAVRWTLVDLRLREALDAIHHSSLVEESTSAIAIISDHNEVIRSLRKTANDKNEGNAGKGRFRFQSTPDKLKEDCLLVPPIYSEGTGGLPSLILRMREDLFNAFDVPAYYSASRGRIPVVVNLDLDHHSKSETLTVNDSQWRQIEWLCARLMRHPAATDKGWIVPPDEKYTDPAIVTIRPTGSRSLYLSSEGFVSLGLLATEFDANWNARMKQEYFITYLIALHQSMVLQHISWLSFNRSFTGKTSETAYHDSLFRMFREFDTSFCFTRISNHVNIQAVYEATRKVLGVTANSEEVRSELQNWIDSELREEQRNLNALAVIAILFSSAVFLPSLNFTIFNRDSAISASEWNGLWYWIPAALTLVFSVCTKRIREHWTRAIRYLIGNKSATNLHRIIRSRNNCCMDK